MFKCEICQKGPPSTSVFRINEKGVPGIWRCDVHFHTGELLGPNPDSDSLTKELVELIDRNQPHYE